jgi:hypothetical protein
VTDADDSLARYRQAIEDLISDGMLYTTIDEFVSNNSARRLEVLLIQSFRRCAARQDNLESDRMTARGLSFYTFRIAWDSMTFA